MLVHTCMASRDCIFRVGRADDGPSRSSSCRIACRCTHGGPDAPLLAASLGRSRLFWTPSCSGLGIETSKAYDYQPFEEAILSAARGIFSACACVSSFFIEKCLRCSIIKTSRKSPRPPGSVRGGAILRSNDSGRRCLSHHPCRSVVFLSSLEADYHFPNGDFCSYICV